MKYITGLRVNGKINNIVDFGIFVDLPAGRHGLIHESDFDGKWTVNKGKFEVGQKVRVVVLDNTNGRLSLSLQRVDDPELIDPTNSFNQQKDFVKSLNDLLTKSTVRLNKLKEELK
ncbi:S1 RNA-binding domain-containing protein [Lactobacillus sp. PV034]|uniref:S1 RNA-binding domain-containing protein n=1 Tax=Lactobacillus sp. PV034 TaxID=2594495 RepID=UPI002240615F|nr:S1 RNA-binding domain-containing protein [Lactobacillus sp. PV034]QNQ81335.1 S1 RNA-binding domain-containing protein [Lactobacillus sp. PV034]